MSGKISFFKSVENYVDKAAAFTDIPKGLVEQIKACNLVLQIRFPIRVDGNYQVIEAYRAARAIISASAGTRSGRHSRSGGEISSPAGSASSIRVSSSAPEAPSTVAW